MTTGDCTNTSTNTHHRKKDSHLVLSNANIGPIRSNKRKPDNLIFTRMETPLISRKLSKRSI